MTAFSTLLHGINSIAFMELILCHDVKDGTDVVFMMELTLGQYKQQNRTMIKLEA